jgi:hypothetical protein
MNRALIEGHGTLPSGGFGCQISYLGDDYTLVDVSIGPGGPNQLLYHYSVIFSFEAELFLSIVRQFSMWRQVWSCH